MGAVRLDREDLPGEGWRYEVWGDSTVWVCSPDGDRMRLREWLDREGAETAAAPQA